MSKDGKEELAKVDKLVNDVTNDWGDAKLENKLFFKSKSDPVVIKKLPDLFDVIKQYFFLGVWFSNDDARKHSSPATRRSTPRSRPRRRTRPRTRGRTRSSRPRTRRRRRRTARPSREEPSARPPVPYAFFTQSIHLFIYLFQNAEKKADAKKTEEPAAPAPVVEAAPAKEDTPEEAAKKAEEAAKKAEEAAKKAEEDAKKAEEAARLKEEAAKKAEEEAKAKKEKEEAEKARTLITIKTNHLVGCQGGRREEKGGGGCGRSCRGAEEEGHRQRLRRCSHEHRQGH